MNYSAQNLAKALVKMASDDPDNFKKLSENFIVFCKKMHLEHLLPNILSYLEIEAKREENTKTFRIFSAVELGEGAVKKIQKSVGAESSSSVKIIKDKDIIAGFIACYDNKIIDASLENNLRLLKNKIINN